MTYYTKPIEHSGRNLQGCLMSETSRACTTTCAGGEMDAGLLQWPNYFNLLCPTGWILGSWSVLVYRALFEVTLK